MINGKFFTGLPEKMLEKSAHGPNRQKTNFYWPDDSDIEPVLDTKSKRKQQEKSFTLAQNHKQNNCNYEHTKNTKTSDIEPKDLFKKQLSSKIEFYDIIDDTKKQNEKLNSSLESKTSNLARNKAKQTFTSKIQFYDFIDEKQQQQQQKNSFSLPITNKNSKTELEKNSKNSPKTKDKRIKFIEQNYNKNDEENDIDETQLLTLSKNKSILKNNQTRPVITTPKTSEPLNGCYDSKSKSSQDKLVTNKKLITKRNTSKSVENLPRSKSVGDFANENTIKIIENDVKNLRLRKQNYIDDDDDDDDDYEYQNEKQIHQQQRYLEDAKRKSKWNQHQNNYYQEEIPNERYEQQDRTYRNNKKHQQNEYDDNDDNNGNWNKFSTNQVSINKTNGTLSQDKNNNDDHSNNDDYYDAKRKRRPTEIDTNESNYNHREIQRNYDEDVQHSLNNKQNSLTNNARSHHPQSTRQEANVNRAHRHLVSNIGSILFGGNDNDNNTMSNGRPVKNARNYAVSRVSVGLPD